jgi:hypothetical protein
MGLVGSVASAQSRQRCIQEGICSIQVSSNGLKTFLQMIHSAFIEIRKWIILSVTLLLTHQIPVYNKCLHFFLLFQLVFWHTFLNVALALGELQVAILPKSTLCSGIYFLLFLCSLVSVLMYHLFVLCILARWSYYLS